MDLKSLQKLVAEIQDLHKTKLSLAKEINSGQLELEALLLRRQSDITHSKESEVNRSANDLVLRIAKFFFSEKTVLSSHSAVQSPTRAKSPDTRARSPPPFRCGLSPAKAERQVPPRPARSDAANELMDLKKEAENLLRDYYMKYVLKINFQLTTGANRSWQYLARDSREKSATMLLRAPRKLVP